jgi:serine/threonine-protein kinase RsbW
MTRRITVEVPATLDGVRHAAMTVRRFLDRLPVPPRDAARCELVLAEAMNNVVEHSGVGGETPVAVRLEAGRNLVCLTVSHRGSRVCPDGLNTFMSSAAVPDGTADGGRGLLLIREIVDEATWSREGDRNVLVMHVRLQGGAT